MFELKVICNTPEELREMSMRLTLPIVTNNSESTEVAPSIEVAPPPSTEVVAPPAASTEEGLLDADNVPWDARIHAGTKTRTAKNIWKKKKGVDDDTYNSVMTELMNAATSGGLNHSQLLQQMVEGFADGTISIFQVSDALVNHNLSSLNDASGNNEVIEALARELGLL